MTVYTGGQFIVSNIGKLRYGTSVIKRYFIVIPVMTEPYHILIGIYLGRPVIVIIIVKLICRNAI